VDTRTHATADTGNTLTHALDLLVELRVFPVIDLVHNTPCGETIDHIVRKM